MGYAPVTVTLPGGGTLRLTRSGDIVTYKLVSMPGDSGTTPFPEGYVIESTITQNIVVNSPTTSFGVIVANSPEQGSVGITVIAIGTQPGDTAEGRYLATPDTSATDSLDALLGSFAGYAQVTDTMKQIALDGARVPDEAGHWPSDTQYTPTYDVYFAALSIIPILEAQPEVTSASSEGTSVSATRTDWNAIRAHYRGLSPIYSAGDAVLKVLPIPDPPHVVRVPMHNTGGYYGDVDTDIG